jgi:endonuclease/exonuclease/phosphatase family metal-dependent hydrolase
MLNIKVLTVNIHKGFTALNRQYILPELREALRSVAADIVFLQEVTGSNLKHSARNSDFADEPHYEYLADSIWSQYAYGRNSVYSHGHHGNAILSKFPIIAFKNHDISISGPERRGLLHCTLEIPEISTQVHAICVHLSLLKSHRTQQLRQLGALIDHVVPSASPLVVAGDFNDWGQHAHTALADSANLAETFVVAQGKAARSFPALWPVLRLDRIYVRGALSHSPIELPFKPWRHLSDHVPLAATVNLN